MDEGQAFRRWVVLPIVLLAAWPCHAAEPRPSYDFVEIGWTSLHASHHGQGPALNASISLSQETFLYAGGSWVDFAHGHGNADALRVGAGFNHAFGSGGWDIVGRGAVQHLEEGDLASYGYQIEGGFKGKFTPHVEAWAMAGYSRWIDGHFHDQAFGRFGVLYEFNHHFGMVADAVVGPHEKEYFLGVSFLF